MSRSIPVSPPLVARIVYYDRRSMAERGRLGGQRTAEAYDPHARMARARDAFNRRFLDQADPNGTLDPDERVRQVAELRREYYRRLALLAIAARRARKVAQEAGQA